jgi:hypothetical protein
VALACGSSREFDQPSGVGGEGPAAGSNGEGDAGSSSGGSTQGPGGGSAGGPANEPEAGTGGGGGGDEPSLCEPTAVAARLVAPLTSSVTTSRRPTVTWEVGDDCGPQTVEFCEDRECANVVAEVQVAANEQEAASEQDLPPGVVFWRVRGSGVVSLTWHFHVGQGTPVDSSWGTLPDFNGDGFGDVAVGTSNGTVYAYYGSADGIAGEPTPLSVAGGAGFTFGGLLASGGDVNGDGYTDLLVSLDGATQDEIWVYAGGENGIDDEPIAKVEVGGLTVIEDPRNWGLGSALRGGGDLNRDGYADFLVGSPESGNSPGSVTPFFGGRAGVSAGAAFYAPGAPAGLGGALAFCDVDGDGATEVIAGAPDAMDGSEPAPVLVLGGSGSSLIAVDQLQAAAGFGATVACGDFEYDGFPEVTAAWPSSGERGYEDGDIWLFPNVGALAGTGASLPNQASGSYVQSGQVMVPLGDMNGDGIWELGVTQYSGRGMRVFFAPGSTRVADVVALSGANDTEAIAITSSDVNGDGLADLLASSPDHSSGPRVEIFLGSKVSRIVTPTALYIEAPEGAEGFGLSLSASL